LIAIAEQDGEKNTLGHEGLSAVTGLMHKPTAIRAIYMSNTFTLDPRLEAESLPFGRLKFCEVRLFDDARFPWLVLVPRRAALVEIIDLDAAEQMALLDDIIVASRMLKAATKCHKLNVAALGNQVRQLHVHVIARFESDGAWPNPVWGRGKRVPYDPQAAANFTERLKAAMGLR
jgi:diadenosine tetraphosphate (Ap4A) HIT family hydrolase